MKCLFMYNPVSGKCRILKHLDYIKEELSKKYGQVDVYATVCPKDMENKAREACGKYDILYFAGGDGSYNEVVNGIAESENKPVLAYIPTGTVNDIARTFKIPHRNIRRALKVLLKSDEKEVDLIKINERYAFYVVCAGAFTGCSYLAAQNYKKRVGKLAYVFEILKNELKLKDFEAKIKVNGEILDTNCEFIILTNSMTVGSLPINLGVVFDDGLIDLLVVKQVKKPDILKKVRAFFCVINFFFFGIKLTKGSVYEKRIGSEFEIDVPDDIVWNFDGEKGVSGKVNIKVLQKYYKVLVPRKAKITGND